MKTQTPLPLQPKWICAAAIGALTMGAIVGAHAADAAGDLPAPPTVSGQQPLPGGPGMGGPEMGGPDADGPDADGPDGQDDGPPGMGQQDGGPRRGGPQGRGPQQQGGRQGGPRVGQGRDDQDEMGPPGNDMDAEGPGGMGGPGRGGPGRGQGMGGPGMGGPGQDGQDMGRAGQGGPGRGGRGQGGRDQGGRGRGGADMNTADGAARSLERAYRDGGDAQSTGKLKGDAQNLQGQAKDLYAKAMDAYKAKNYDKASALADASSHLSKAVIVLSQGNSPQGPAGWSAPPTLTAAPQEMDQNRAAMSLNRTYRELGHPLETQDATGQQWFNTAKTYYKTASSGYTAKNFDTAQSYAAAADEVVQAAHAVSDAGDL